MNGHVISPIAGTSMVRGATRNLYMNPHFDYLSEMLPRDIKELFSWCEVVFQSMPSIATGIRKLVSYPVTGFSVERASEKVKEKTLALTRELNMLNMLLEYGTDEYVYGNVFRSVWFPFRRFLRCRNCQSMVELESANIKIRGGHLTLKCGECGTNAEPEVVDTPIRDPRQVRIVRWNPRHIELRQNPITGSTQYFYSIPGEFSKRISAGDVALLKDTPWVFVEAALKRKSVQLGANFFHGRAPSLAGFASGWGISPLMSALRIYMYIAVLRRASEAIGMEHITPQRVLFPQTNGSSDPSIMMNMERWRTEIAAALDKWRLDPNYVMTAPFPTGVTNIGSAGRPLMPTAEIKDARLEMALALDIPPALITGDMTVQHSAVGLRILENQLRPRISAMEDFANWVISLINAEMQTEYARVKLIPFRLADDILNKQLLMQGVGNSVSRTTVQEAFGLDPVNESRRMKDEQLYDHDMQVEVEKEIRRRETDIAALSQMEEQEQESGMPSRFNQQKMIAQAQQLAVQLAQYPYEERRSQLAQLQNEDYVMWALVSKQMESLHQQRAE